MTDKITPMFAGQRTGTEPVQELIDLMEELTTQAKTGALQTFAFVGECADTGMAFGVCGGGGDVFALLGALRIVEQRLIDQVEDE